MRESEGNVFLQHAEMSLRKVRYISLLNFPEAPHFLSPCEKPRNINRQTVMFISPKE